MAWYYAEDGRQQGPVSDPEFESMVRQGEVRNDTLVWREGMADWRPYGEVAAATPVAGAVLERDPAMGMVTAGMANCVECGRLFPVGEMLPYRGVFVCATCKPIFFQRVQEGAALPTMVNYAGFWIRFVAKVIDSIILQVVNAGVYALFLPLLTRTDSETAAVGVIVILSLVGVGLTVGYNVFFLGRFGATPGKMALGLKVIRPGGMELTYLRALG
ncbi:MAG: RDD family protein, partial [Candidatus Hydrogenedentales bacterium]